MCKLRYAADVLQLYITTYIRWVMKNLKILTVGILVGVIGICALSWLVPKPADAEVAAYYSPFGTVITLFDSGIAIGASILLLRAVRNFKPELKPAYRFLAWSALLYGILTLVYPYIEYNGQWENIPLSISSYAAYFFAGPLMYFGAREFYKRVNLKGKVAAPWLIAAIIAVLWVIHVFAPHAADVWPHEWLYELMQVITLVPTITYAAAAYMMWRVRSVTGQSYGKPFGWFAAGLALQVIGAGSVVVLEIIGYENWYFSSRAIWAPIILGDVCILIAGYYFNTVGVAAPGSWLKRLFGRKATSITSMDIITHVAEMASDPAKIDPYLDKMRVVTARLEPGQELSAADQVTLRDVYIKIEMYLVSDDQLRRYTREQLRADLTRSFDLDSNARLTFWPLLK